MSCISASARRIGGINSTTLRIGGITSDVSRIGGISASANLVCDINITRYLKVKPEEVMWITVDMPVTYDVISNVDWVVS